MEVRVLILAYHRVNPEIRDGLSVSPSMLAQHIEWLRDRGYQNVVLEDVLADGDVDAPAKSFAVTFDDGYRDNYFHAAPVLEEMGVKATVYLVSDMIDTEEPFRWLRPGPEGFDKLDFHMTSRQILKARDRGVFVYGSHTLTHPFLTQLETSEVRRQLLDSRRNLEQLLQSEVSTFCYPAGDFSDRTLELVGESGYRAAVVTPNRHIPETMFTLHRVGIYSHITLRLFDVKTNRLLRAAQHSRAFWRIRSKVPRPNLGRRRPPT